MADTDCITSSAATISAEQSDKQNREYRTIGKSKNLKDGQVFTLTDMI